MAITAITVHLQWLEALITLAISKDVRIEQAREQMAQWGKSCYAI